MITVTFYSADSILLLKIIYTKPAVPNYKPVI